MYARKPCIIHMLGDLGQGDLAAIHERARSRGWPSTPNARDAHLLPSTTHIVPRAIVGCCLLSRCSCWR